MIGRKLLDTLCIAAVAALCGATFAHAQLFRGYLKSTGNDSNPCTVDLPCRLLSRALGVTIGGGEVWMLDSANYNNAPVTITKSVTILAIPGAVGSLVAISGGDALDVNTDSSTGQVTLRNLVIGPFGSSFNNGVTFQNGASLTVDDCKFDGPLNAGIEWALQSPSGGHLTIHHSEFSNSNNAIEISQGAAGSVADVSVFDTVVNRAAHGFVMLNGGTLNMDGAHLIGRGLGASGAGVQLVQPSTGTVGIAAHISNSDIGSWNAGILATQTSPTPTVRVSVFGSELKHSNTAVESDDAQVVVTGSRVVHNAKGVTAPTLGAVKSTGDNVFSDNGSDGDPMGTAALK